VHACFIALRNRSISNPVSTEKSRSFENLVLHDY